MHDRATAGYPGAMRDRRPRAWLFAAMILLAGIGAIVWIAFSRGTTKDLDVYLLAGRWFARGGDVYAHHFGRTLATPLPYTYPPLWAAVAGAVAWLPWRSVAVAWTVLDIALLVWVVHAAYASFLDRLGAQRPIALAVLVVVLGLTAPVLSVLDLGQIGLVLMALVLADTLPRRRRLPQGLLVGAATAIKLVPGIFIPYWMLTKRPRAAVTGLVVAIGLWILTALLRPDLSSSYWLDVVFDPGRTGDARVLVDQSINGALLRTGFAQPALWAIIAGVALVVGYARARAAHAAGDELAAVSLVALAGLLASPVSWIHHAVWIVPVTGVLLGDGRDRRRRLAWVATVAVFVLHVPLWERAGMRFDGVAATIVDNAFVLVFWLLLFFLPTRAEKAPVRDDRPVGDPGVSVP